ncbi:Crotonobetainyl-CoA:carnitine CoA-transferase CaiB [Saccharopolyspora kobensis]|uniref:Crotonobetainyl-CoA:carnitine CoA-transferase CaiB n=2 Tax=Saccharopolyspora kobensis TaxID=146035 RepID=A0A1H5ZL34_9PSEU|nr:CoA transferase [Saccharopolyspora kobensis]SEG37159.1 Crotonobetainyl-CoA:carnitine CoA-transferase CaiB [Saccharopolyspora kobensis]SFF21150.1 Crotonobetainyl-CoA:carnitine CoA-transferase CaiB [Saccharopolyspora kobensis]
MTGPLTGIRVLDLGQYIAGPCAAQVLGDLGAEVLKVESLRGDQARHIGPFGEAMVQAYNRDKRSIALDLRDPDGRRVLHRLLGTADVLVQNFRPGSAEQLGIDAETLRREHPRLICASVTGFGSRGPSRERPGLDIAAQAEYGLMHATGAADGEPQRVGFPVADVTAANALATGVLAALLERERSGRGAHVETSLLEAVISAQAATWGEYVLTGTAPRRKGNGQANAAPAADVLALTDGAIVLSAYTAEKWAALCELVGRPDMVDDPRFADNGARVRNRPEMLAALRSAFAGMTREQAITALRAAGIVCGAVRSFDEVAADADVACSNVMVEVTDRSGRRVTSPGTAFTLDGLRRTASAAAPAVGADTAEVLRELGYPDEAISDLTTRRVVGAPTARPDERRAPR